MYTAVDVDHFECNFNFILLGLGLLFLTYQIKKYLTFIAIFDRLGSAEVSYTTAVHEVSGYNLGLDQIFVWFVNS